MSGEREEGLMGRSSSLESGETKFLAINYPCETANGPITRLGGFEYVSNGSLGLETELYGLDLG